LLQPIGITRDKKLVFGQRRIEAFKLLGRDTIQARIIPIESIVRGEHDENECRLNFTVSERVAILQAIGRKPEGRPTGYSADLPSYGDAAKLANFESERTARNAEKVVAAGSPELVEAMDKGGLSIDAAAVIAKQPAEVQRTIVQAPKPERKAAVSKLRKPKVLPSPSAFYVPAPPSTELDAQKDRQGTSVRLVPWDRAANKAAFAEANWLKSDLQALRNDIDEIINTPVLQ
jgi:ParB-like chromosome segregation protein Spo0J